jgi:hypothetical protein
MAFVKGTLFTYIETLIDILPLMYVYMQGRSQNSPRSRAELANLSPSKRTLRQRKPTELLSKHPGASVSGLVLVS